MRRMLCAWLSVLAFAAPAMADVSASQEAGELPPLPPLFKPQTSAPTTLPSSVAVPSRPLLLPSILLNDHTGPALSVPLSRKISIIGGGGPYEPTRGTKATKAFLGVQVKF